MLAFSDRVRAYVAPGGGPRRINRLVHSVHNVFPEMVEPRYDRAFIELEQRCRKRSLVVLMTNLFDELSAQLVGEYLRNLTGRHLPLGVFLRDHDLFALADRAPDDGLGLYPGAAAAALLNWRERVAGRAAAARGLDPRRVSRGTDGRAGQSLPRDQGPTPALTRVATSLSSARVSGDRPMDPFPPPDDPDLDNPYAPPQSAFVPARRSPELSPACRFTVDDVFNWSWAIFKERHGLPVDFLGRRSGSTGASASFLKLLHQGTDRRRPGSACLRSSLYF